MESSVWWAQRRERGQLTCAHFFFFGYLFIYWTKFVWCVLFGVTGFFFFFLCCVHYLSHYISLHTSCVRLHCGILNWLALADQCCALISFSRSFAWRSSHFVFFFWGEKVFSWKRWLPIKRSKRNVIFALRSNIHFARSTKANEKKRKKKHSKNFSFFQFKAIG